MPLHAHQPPRRIRVFTLIELLVVVAIIGILAAMLLPVLTKAKTKARVGLCLNQHHQLYLASSSFAGDNDDFMPDDLQMAYKDDVGMQSSTGAMEASPPVPVGYSPSSYAYHPVVELQEYKSGNGVPAPIAIGMGALYAKKYINTPELYYCADQTQFQREMSISYRKVGWRTTGVGWLDAAGKDTRWGTSTTILASMRYYYARSTAGKQPMRYGAIPKADRVPQLADLFSWDEVSEKTSLMRFPHGNQGCNATYLDGSAEFHLKPSGGGPGYTANLTTWVSYSTQSGAWGSDKGYWVGTKYVDPTLNGAGGSNNYRPNFTTGAHSMTVFDWWVFDRR